MLEVKVIKSLLTSGVSLNARPSGGRVPASLARGRSRREQPRAFGRWIGARARRRRACGPPCAVARASSTSFPSPTWSPNCAPPFAKRNFEVGEGGRHGVTSSSRSDDIPSSPPEPGSRVPPTIRPPQRATSSRQLLTLYGHRVDLRTRRVPARVERARHAGARLSTRTSTLPERRLFIELTVLAQRLVTKKNRRFATSARSIPEIPLLVVYQRDFHALAASTRSAISWTGEPPKET